MMEDDIPPEWMWPFDEEISKWFDELKEEKANSSGRTEQLTEVPMMENELAAGRGR